MENIEILNEYNNNDEVRIIDHEFIDGDSLESIAKKYHKTRNEIIKFNKMEYPYHLEPLQIIHIKCNKADLCYNDSNQDIELVTPIKGSIIKRFHDKGDQGNFAALIFGSPNGAVVRASMSGKVIYQGYDSKFGNIMIIEQDGYHIAYGYMKIILVKKGDKIQLNQKIGFVGNIPNSNNSGLYMAFRKHNQPIDPEQYFQ